MSYILIRHSFTVVLTLIPNKLPRSTSQPDCMCVAKGETGAALSGGAICVTSIWAAQIYSDIDIH